MSGPSTFQVYNASAGSGKTFTLVKEYLKIILQDQDPRRYQQILAITFTNKAANEMKDRILENLLQFSTMDVSSGKNDMALTLMEETRLSLSIIQKRSKDRLQDILKNYASFHIKTIDSFTNKLIKSFAFDLGLTMDFEVELDTDSILKESVDAVISRIGTDKELTAALVDFAREKTLEDKSWDISRELFEVSKLLLNENHIHELEKLSDKKLSDFKILAQKLQKDQRSKRKLLAETGSKAIELIRSNGIDLKDFYRSQLPNFFLKMINSPEKLDFDHQGSLAKNIDARLFYGKSKPEQVKRAIDQVEAPLISLYLEAKKIFERYNLNDMVLKNLIPLAVISAIHSALEEIKANNNIRLHAEFNQMISDHLTREPVAFIYEKLGEKFKHFFIDEMQDTSVLQWQNLIPLIDNALSSEDASALLVGDAKQAIYRWRGGRAEQFIDLSSDKPGTEANPFNIPKKVNNLGTNYRSHAEIIEFNNQFFTHVAKHFENKDYATLYRTGNNQHKNLKEGGYVRLQFIEEMKGAELKDEIYPKKVFDTIQGLKSDYDLGDICVLVRKKKEGVAIAKYLTEKEIPIVSSETLLVKNNKKVGFVISLLKLIAENKNDDAKFEVLDFLHGHLNIIEDKHDFIQAHVKLDPGSLFSALEVYQINYNIQQFNTYSIFEGVEDIIRSFKLTQGSDAFLQFFLDFVFDYTQRKSQKNISFLEFWEEKSEKLNIVNSEGIPAVQIMTIHKSKGLEFPVVIFPYDLDIYFERNPKAWYKELDQVDFNGFESILVDSTSRIQKAGTRGEMILESQRKEKQLDSFNLLYVCLTRAVEQLYIISEDKLPTEKLGWSSHLFKDFLENSGHWEAGKLIYEFGERRRLGSKRLSGSHAETQIDFISSSWKDHQINIVANSSLLWDSKRGSAIGYGNLIHEMMSHIYSVSDIDKTIEGFVNKGLLPKAQMADGIKTINSIVLHPELKAYFDPEKKVFTEREILTESGQILIPDRLVFQGKQVVVIDYKTGRANSDHQRQIDAYAMVLEKLKFEVLEKVLVYIDNEITIIKS